MELTTARLQRITVGIPAICLISQTGGFASLPFGRFALSTEVHLITIETRGQMSANEYVAIWLHMQAGVARLEALGPEFPQAGESFRIEATAIASHSSTSDGLRSSSLKAFPLLIVVAPGRSASGSASTHVAVAEGEEDDGSNRQSTGARRRALVRDGRTPLPKSVDKLGDLTPHIASDDNLALLDLVRFKIHVCGSFIHRHNDYDGVSMSMRAAGFTTNRIGPDTSTIQLFSHVSRNFQLAFLECSWCQLVALCWLSNLRNIST